MPCVLSKEFTAGCPETEVPKLQRRYSCRIEVAPLREVPLSRQSRQPLVNAGRGKLVQQPLGTLQQGAVELYSHPEQGRESRVAFCLCRDEKGSIASVILVPYELGGGVCKRSSGLV